MCVITFAGTDATSQKTRCWEAMHFSRNIWIVLREAVEADSSFPGTALPAGSAILVHLAEMNMRCEIWEHPPPGKTFFPFGEGPKGCIGMHLGKREVAAIVECVISQFHLQLPNAATATLEGLATHWDIANQPDEPSLISLTPLFLGRSQRMRQ